MALVSSQRTISLTPASQAAQASGVSQEVPANFAGLGIEPSHLFSFTGAEETNELSVNLLTNLADYAGEPPAIRVGGNSGDTMLWDSSYTGYYAPHNPQASGQGAVPSDLLYFGETYWSCLDRFPKGLEITFGLNLAYQADDYLQRIVDEAAAAVAGLHNVVLKSFEIGNEPDLYLENGFRNGTWGGTVYTGEWTTRAAAIYEQVLRPAGIPADFFEPPAPASTIAHPDFAILELITNNITAAIQGLDNTTYLRGWNQHDYFYFVDVSAGGLTLDYLMHLDNTNSQFAYWEQQVAIALRTGYPYYLREMASAGPTGLPNITDTFGASLWTLNFFLYAASLNISMVGIHMTDNSWAAPWQPTLKHGLDPYVRPSYYAFAAMAQIIGNGNGTTQVQNLVSPGSLPAEYNGYVREYAIYGHGNLTGLVLINSRLANASDTDKSSLVFNVDLPDYQGQTLYLSYLTADGGDSLSGTLWNNISFETNGDGTPTGFNYNPETVQVSSNGTASITVRDSQAVVANFGWVLGANQVLLANGTAAPNSKTSSATSSSSGVVVATISGVATTIGAIASNTGESDPPRGDSNHVDMGDVLFTVGIGFASFIAGGVFLQAL